MCGGGFRPQKSSTSETLVVGHSLSRSKNMFASRSFRFLPVVFQ